MESLIVVVLLLNFTVVDTTDSVRPQNVTTDCTTTAGTEALLTSSTSVKENVSKTDDSANRLIASPKFAKQNDLKSNGVFGNQLIKATPGSAAKQNELTTDGLETATKLKTTMKCAKENDVKSSGEYGRLHVTSPASLTESTQTTSGDNLRPASPSSATSAPTGHARNERHTYDDVKLQHESMSRCLQTNSTIGYTARHVTISYSHAGDVSVSSSRKLSASSVCWVNVTAPSPDLVFSVLILDQVECSDDNKVAVANARLEDSVYDCSVSSWLAPGWNLLTTTSTADVRLQVGDVSVAYTVRILVSARLRPKEGLLESYTVTPTLGFIQTPGWNPDLGSTTYPRSMFSFIDIDVPVKHTLMVSVVHMDVEGVSYACQSDLLLLLEKTREASLRRVWLGCNSYSQGSAIPVLLHTHMARVVFRSDATVQYYGFRLLYTFHQLSSQPQQLPDGKWNCSVPHWPDFRLHFRCNLVRECAGGEDEASCPYSLCDDGGVSLDNSCFHLIDPGRATSWDESNLACSRMGGRLASLTTPAERRRVTHYLRCNRSGQFQTFLGLKSAPVALPDMYRKALRWQLDQTVDYHTSYTVNTHSRPHCARFSGLQRWATVEKCDRQVPYTRYVCQVDNPHVSHKRHVRNISGRSPIELAAVPAAYKAVHDGVAVVASVECPGGHATHAFLACDVQSACWGDDFVTYHSGSDGWAVPTSSSCRAPLTSLPPSFECSEESRGQRVPYSLVCDHRPDCVDASDEDFCVFPECDQNSQFQCNNKQCVPLDARCDELVQCLDGSDQERCRRAETASHKITRPNPPAIVNFDQHGNINVTEITTEDYYYHYHVAESANGSGSYSLCPETHFRCPGNGYCLPVYVRCNGVYDCPGHEDEVGCDVYTCPGFYRCRASRTCLHAAHVCDGWPQCPQRDDELFCDLTCPENCTCHGLAFFCTSVFAVQRYPGLRYLDARGSGLQKHHLDQNRMLVHLSLAGCRVSHLGNFTLPNLHSLDLSHNRIRVVTTGNLRGVKQLRVLFLAGNPLTSLFAEDSSISFPTTRPTLQTLDLSHVKMQAVDFRILSSLPSLQTLNLSNCGVEELLWSGSANRTASDLRVLDLRGCPVTAFPRNFFKRLPRLHKLQADDFKLCCPAVLPDGFKLHRCSAPLDEISTCDSLIGSGTFRIVVDLLAVTALLGNFVSFVVRVLIKRTSCLSGCAVFATHLSVANFGMGVYLGIVGVADRVYRGVYVWQDASWRHSDVCKAAGVLYAFTSQASTFLISLIVLDRVLALLLPLPLPQRVRFSARTAHAAASAVWGGSLLLAAAPLFPPQWEFYTLKGTCSPLPFTSRGFAGGQDYALAVFTALNSTVILLIAVGLVLITARTRRWTVIVSDGDEGESSADTGVSCLLLAVQLLCRFFSNLVVTLVFLDYAVAADISVGSALVVLPFGSALSPVLHVLSSWLERRRRAVEERLLKLLARRTHGLSAKATSF